MQQHLAASRLGEVTAAIFWLKTRGGWREAPQDHRVGIMDVRQLSDAELENMIAEHLAALGKAPSALQNMPPAKEKGAPVQQERLPRIGVVPA